MLQFEEKQNAIIAHGMTQCDKVEFSGQYMLPEGTDKLEIVVNDDCEVLVEDGKAYVVRKKPTYPKTYEECCKVLNIIPNNKLVFSNPNEESEYTYGNLALYNSFNKLKICRDAYWKMAGDWKPDWKEYTNKYCLFYCDSTAQCDIYTHKQHTLAFPTEEMWDAFYENFKKLIDECKELL
jgi:hypothetical protein